MTAAWLAGCAFGAIALAAFVSEGPSMLRSRRLASLLLLVAAMASVSCVVVYVGPPVDPGVMVATIASNHAFVWAVVIGSAAIIAWGLLDTLECLSIAAASIVITAGIIISVLLVPYVTHQGDYIETVLSWGVVHLLSICILAALSTAGTHLATFLLLVFWSVAAIGALVVLWPDLRDPVALPVLAPAAVYVGAIAASWSRLVERRQVRSARDGVAVLAYILLPPCALAAIEMVLRGLAS